jgi:hypothetical protein
MEQIENIRLDHLYYRLRRSSADLMKKRWTMALGLMALAAASAAFLFFSRNGAKTALEETRRALRKEGFKIDLAEFDLSASPEQRARAAALTNAELTGFTLRSADSVGRAMLLRERRDFLTVVGSNAALVVWQQAKLPSQLGPNPYRAQSEAEEDLWPLLRAACSEGRAALDSACEAAISGPIRFNLTASQGTGMLLPHLAAMRSLAQVLGTRIAVELHDGHPDAAWTNLLASTRLVTAWGPEPSDVSHLARFVCANLAFNATWQALQAEGWADDRLARLQREWESVDYFRGLPETAAFARAAAADLCQRERKEPLGPSFFLRNLVPSPRGAWRAFTERWDRIQYRHHGSYEDERALLLYFRDRELQERCAIQAPTWSEMRPLPGVTNLVRFQSRYQSRMQVLLNMRQLSMGFAGRGQTLLSGAAEAEARRRILIAAIALERYRARHGQYPKGLPELMPELVQTPPVDFMDGQPLRYRLTVDGHVILYSVGLGCVDDGGMLLRRGRGMPLGNLLSPGALDPYQLVWPRPASAAEVQAHNEQVARQADLQRAALQERRIEEELQQEGTRQVVVERLLAAADAGKSSSRSRVPSAAEPRYKGRPLDALLRNETTAGTNQFTLDELLTLRPISNGVYDGTALFEVPVSYDAATNIGFLHLVVDGRMDVSSQREEGDRQTWERAANGNCLLGWIMTYDPPGKHAIQAEFITTRDEAKMDIAQHVKGPAIAFVSTNLCQFDSAYDHFDAHGVTLYARLVEPRGVYSIELKTPTGEAIKTLEGATSNGVIRLHWDLIDDKGSRCTNQSIDSVFHITLPGSGRSQTLKGP